MGRRGRRRSAVPLTSDNKVTCPFHDDAEPSCAIYPDHFHCFGCGERGSRLDWLMRVEGMTTVEAVAYKACLSGFYPHPQDVGCFQAPE